MSKMRQLLQAARSGVKVPWDEQDFFSLKFNCEQDCFAGRVQLLIGTDVYLFTSLSYKSLTLNTVAMQSHKQTRAND